MAHHVMVRQGPARPGIRCDFLQLCEDIRDPLRGQIMARQQVEHIGHVQPFAFHALRRARIFLEQFKRPLAIADLAHRYRAIAFQKRIEPFEKCQIFGLRLVVFMALMIVGVHCRRGIRLAMFRHERRIVPQLRIVEIEVDRVQPESVNPLLQPEFGHIQKRILNVAIVEIQIRLGGQEVVQVILFAPRIPLPGAAAKDRQPVVRRRSVRLGIRPDIPAGFRIIAAGTAFREPRVLIRTVRHYQIDHDLQAKLMRAFDQPVEILHAAEDRIDAAIIADIIPEILHRRCEEG